MSLSVFWLCFEQRCIPVNTRTSGRRQPNVRHVSRNWLTSVRRRADVICLSSQTRLRRADAARLRPDLRTKMSARHNRPYVLPTSVRYVGPMSVRYWADKQMTSPRRRSDVSACLYFTQDLAATLATPTKFLEFQFKLRVSELYIEVVAMRGPAYFSCGVTVAFSPVFFILWVNSSKLCPRHYIISHSLTWVHINQNIEHKHIIVSSNHSCSTSRHQMTIIMVTKWKVLCDSTTPRESLSPTLSNTCHTY